MNDIFSIFNPDWWMDENNNALQMTDAVLFIAGHPRSLLVYLCIGLLAEIQESLSTVPQATSVPGPLCCAEKRQGSDRVHQSFP